MNQASGHIATNHSSANTGLAMFNSKLLYSRVDSAQLLSMSLRTLDRLIAEKEISVRRVRGRVYITRDTLAQFIKRDHPAGGVQ